jgi:hypothetical protein
MYSPRSGAKRWTVHATLAQASKTRWNRYARSTLSTTAAGSTCRALVAHGAYCLREALSDAGGGIQLRADVVTCVYE